MYKKSVFSSENTLSGCVSGQRLIVVAALLHAFTKLKAREAGEFNRSAHIVCGVFDDFRHFVFTIDNEDLLKQH